MTEELKWNKPEYQRMLSGNVVGENLIVNFQDGSAATINRTSILPHNAQNPEWDQIRIFPNEIVIQTSLGETEIPWLTIRILSDAEFAAYWANQAEEQAKDIGNRIRVLRKSRNLSSKEVAERAGIAPQSLSRIEQGRHDVVFTTLRRILAAMGCTLKDLANVQTVPPSLNGILKRLETLGIKKEWLLGRIIPPETLLSGDEGKTTIKLNEAARYIARVFGWTPEQILTDSYPLQLNISAAYNTKFKTRGHIQEKQVSAYSLYAHYLALLVLQATDQLQSIPIPENPDEIRNEIIRDYGLLNLENALTYIWAHGIPVIPLSDPGTFHGACWKVSGRFIIVLKQVTKFQARWLYDLIHELGHIVKHLKNRDETSIVEVEEISPFIDSDDEEEANEFATNVLFSQDAEDLTQLCVNQAKGKAENLKAAVIQVAANEHVPIDLLANYMAWRLSLTNKNINWWGTANNLQITEPSPWYLAKKILMEQLKPESLPIEDYNLVMRALENEREES